MKLRLIPYLLTACVSTGLLAGAQSRYAGTTMDLTVKGTSTLHDWSMKSLKADCSGNFTIGASGQIIGVEGLVFSTPATGLKSEHESMDNNAYKALKTDKNPTISYTVYSVTVSPAEAGGTVVTCKGKLTIAGASRDEEIVTLCRLNADNTITVDGTERISMKDYRIDPPSFMLGAVKTGDAVVLSFHLTLGKIN